VVDQALNSVDKVEKKTNKLEAIYMSYINQLKSSYRDLQDELLSKIKELTKEKEEAYMSMFA
jgi:hypothetical protein